MQETVIRVENLTKAYHIYDAPHDRLKQLFWGWRKTYYREFLALQNVSFEIEKGQSIGVIGRNGAGKSTLLQLLTGTLTASSGKTFVKGKVAAVLELGSGFNPEFSGRDNIYLYGSLFELDRVTINSRFKDIIAFSDLANFIDQPVKTYSSGMQARLAFSVIAHVDADILIIDEALSVGDAFFSQKCMRFLRKFQENGTIFFVSHDLAAVTAYCDQVIWLEQGQIRRMGAAKEICESYFAEIYSQYSAGGDIQRARNKITIVDGFSTASSLLTSSVIKQNTVSCTDNTLPPGCQQIETFGFNPDSAGFGTGDAKIICVAFTDHEGYTLNACEGGMRVVVKIRAKALNYIDRPIIGFIIKDRLGQPLIGGNTFHAYKAAPMSVGAGDELEAEFYFNLPILAVGDYSIVAAIANGTLQEHVQLHWMHDAVLFKVIATSIDGVIVGMPLEKIIFATLKGTA